MSSYYIYKSKHNELLNWYKTLKTRSSIKDSFKFDFVTQYVHYCLTQYDYFGIKYDIIKVIKKLSFFDQVKKTKKKLSENQQARVIWNIEL